MRRPAFSRLLAASRLSLLEGLPEFFQGPLFDPGDIASGDAEGGGNLPLGQGHGAPQAVAEADNLRLPGGEALPDEAVEPDGVVPVVEVLQHGVVHPHDVHELEGVSVLVGVDGVGEGHLPLELFLTPEVHEDFVFDAPGGVGGQAGPFGGVEAGDALDETDGADGNQVLLVGALGVVLFGRVKQKEKNSGNPTDRKLSRGVGGKWYAAIR